MKNSALAHELLLKHFGYPSFRQTQLDVIDAVCEGKDVLAVMPTGAGKSICYQIPALMLYGVTLVFSPLISLMKDQIDSLRQAAIPATFLNSSLSANEAYDRIQNVKAGGYKLIYIAPERLGNAGFLELLKGIDISMVAIDEAHCISQWGHDFRPSYLAIERAMRELKKRPIIAAFTATATSRVREDIKRSLKLENPVVKVDSFDRPNLIFYTTHPQDKDAFTIEFIKERPDFSGIVYAGTRKNVELVCSFLIANGIKALPYHAGLTEVTRTENQEAFVFDRVQVMVATNAFGMGIDKSNIGYIIHYNMPKDMESYYQEAGRAGRDGNKAQCILLYGGEDYSLGRYLIENSQSKKPPELKQEEFAKLERMRDYSYAESCLRANILSYFGEIYPQDNCASCSYCQRTADLMDITIEAQKILSCMKRMGEKHNDDEIISVLTGICNEELENAYASLSTYGIMAEYQKSSIREMIDSLKAQGFISSDDSPMLLKGAYGILRGINRCEMKVQVKVKGLQRLSSHYNDALLAALKNQRMIIAKEQGVPPFMIFSDAALIAMCMKLPSDLHQMMGVPGVGSIKNEKYGLAFLDVINEYKRKKGHIASLKQNKRAKAMGDDILLLRLERIRAGISVKNELVPIMIFSDSALSEMALHKPCTEEEMMRIKGVNARNFRLYGDEFLKVIINYLK